MTDSQRTRFYIPAWVAASAALGWRMHRGRLMADLEHQSAAASEYPAGHPLRDLLPRIIALAGSLAVQAHRAVNADDLRHACNSAASGWRHTSAQKLSNQEVTRVVALWRLMLDAEDLAAVMDWENPADWTALGLRRVLRLKERAAVAIARNAFGTEDLDNLDVGKLRWLAGKISTTDKHG